MSIDTPTWKPTSGYNCPECKKLFISHETFMEHVTKCGRISAAELDELELACAKLAEGPYFVNFDDARDCADHANSGLAMVDTGRSEDWPIARLCEWPTAKAIAAILPVTSHLIAALRTERSLAEMRAKCIQKMLADCKRLAEAIEDTPPTTSDISALIDVAIWGYEHRNKDIESLRAELEAEKARNQQNGENRNG